MSQFYVSKETVLLPDTASISRHRSFCSGLVDLVVGVGHHGGGGHLLTPAGKRFVGVVAKDIAVIVRSISSQPRASADSGKHTHLFQHPAHIYVDLLAQESIRVELENSYYWNFDVPTRGWYARPVAVVGSGYDLLDEYAAVSAPRPSSPLGSTSVSCHRWSAMSVISPCHLRDKVLKLSNVVIQRMRSMPSILGLATDGQHHVHELTRTVSNDSARRSPAGLLPPWVFSQWCEDHGPYQPRRFDLMLKQGVSFHVRVAEGDGLPMLGVMRQEVRWQ